MSLLEFREKVADDLTNDSELFIAKERCIESLLSKPTEYDITPEDYNFIITTLNCSIGENDYSVTKEYKPSFGGQYWVYSNNLETDALVEYKIENTVKDEKVYTVAERDNIMMSISDEIDKYINNTKLDPLDKGYETVAKEFGITEENAPRFVAFSTDEARINSYLKEEHRSMYGYFEEEQLVGYYSLLIQNGQECELNNLCVLPSYRHKRIGDQLLKNAYENARNMNCKKMNISIVEENQVLRKWYENHGFVHIRTEKYDFFPFTCGYLMKELM